MKINEMKEWIDKANYQELLNKWRFEPSGSQWFTGEISDYFKQVMFAKKDKLSPSEQVTASKNVGWDK